MTFTFADTLGDVGLITIDGTAGVALTDGGTAVTGTCAETYKGSTTDGVLGTGATATPADAATVHAAIRSWMTARGAAASAVRILYGGSVKPANAEELLAEREIDGVLVGGASVQPDSWTQICTVPLN